MIPTVTTARNAGISTFSTQATNLRTMRTVQYTAGFATNTQPSAKSTDSMYGVPAKKKGG